MLQDHANMVVLGTHHCSVKTPKEPTSRKKQQVTGLASLFHRLLAYLRLEKGLLSNERTVDFANSVEFRPKFDSKCGICGHDLCDLSSY